MAIRFLTILLSTFFLTSFVHAQEHVLERSDWKKFFSDLQAEGAIVIADERQAEHALLVFGQERAAKRYSPASTFKLPHTLFALDAGAVRDEFQVFRWDGVKRSFAGHNQDQDLRSAMRNSAVGLPRPLDIMRDSVTAEISTQLSKVLSVIEHHLEPTLLAVHLYGSAVDGGLKPYSDIDLLVTVTARLDDTTRRALFNDLLEVSAFPGESEILRAIEVTIVVHEDIMPWRYPAKRELQFGEWQRNDILAGIFEPATIDIDLAILLTKAREHSVALVGPAAEELFDPVPEQDLIKALNETLKLWNSQPDWAGDERNVVLTLSRIWYSAATGKIAPKDVAANWAMEHLPAQHQSVLLEARQAYLGQEEDRSVLRADKLEEFIHFMKSEITKVLGNDV